jgi:hypothetical protein
METVESFGQNELFAGCAFHPVGLSEIKTYSQEPFFEIDKTLAILTLEQFVNTPQNQAKFTDRFHPSGSSDWEVVLSSLGQADRQRQIDPFHNLAPFAGRAKAQMYNRPLAQWAFREPEMGLHPDHRVHFPKVDLSSPAVLTLSPVVVWRYGFSVNTKFPYLGKTEDQTLKGAMYHVYQAFLQEEAVGRSKRASEYSRLRPYLMGRYYRFWDEGSAAAVEDFMKDIDWSATTANIMKYLYVASPFIGGLPNTGKRA